MFQWMGARAGKSGSRARALRPRLETLEDRCVPAAVTTYFSDHDGGLFSVDVATGKTRPMGSVGVELRALAISPAGQAFGVGRDNKLLRINGFGGSAPTAS